MGGVVTINISRVTELDNVYSPLGQYFSNAESWNTVTLAEINYALRVLSRQICRSFQINYYVADASIGC